MSSRNSLQYTDDIAASDVGIFAAPARSRAARPMRFLIVPSDKYPPSRVDVHVLFGTEMPARGHVIDWVMQSEAPQKKARRQPYGGGTAHVGPAAAGDHLLAKVSRGLQQLANSFRVVGLARRNRYDFIQAKNVFFRALPALFAARSTGARFVYWLSYPYPESWVNDARMRATRHPALVGIRGRVSMFLLYRVILPSADFVFVQSEQMRRDLAARGVPVAKMHPVPMGVSADMIAAGSPRVEREPIVLYVGTMVAVRRLEFVIRVFKQVVAAVPDAKLYMVGGETPSDIERLRNEAEALGVSDSVVFTGKLPLAEALGWMRRARVGVSPFYPTPLLNSTSPTKLVEYMSQGAAVVANDHPEQRKVIEESGGGICVRYEEGAFAEAIIALLRDRALAMRCGESGRAYVRRFRAYPQIASELATKYEELIEARP